MPALILIAVLVVAACLFGRFLSVHRSLWDDPFHDRNAHYLYGLKIATAVRGGHLLVLLNELNEGRIWPPLHGVLTAGVLLVGGLDHRLAVLPSLAGWVLTVFFGFLTARRSVLKGGTFAGLIAVVFIASSPAHRAYATDIMLESLGAGLSLMALYAYLLTAQGHPDESGKARFLAISSLALFLEKYNYWLLIVVALLVTEGLNQPQHYREAISRIVRAIDWRRWISSQVRSLLLWSAGLMLLVCAFVLWRGDRPMLLAGRRVSLYPPHNLLSIAYWLMFLRLAPWWWRRGRHLLRDCDNRVRQLVLWHVCPLCVWFLLPKHPSFFLWYLSLGNRTPEQSLDVVAGVRDYGAWFIEDYNSCLICTLLGLGLCAIALLAWRRIPPSGRVVLVLVAVASLLTVIHPNHKGRMLHTWIAAVWVSAGIGAAMLVDGGATTRWPRLRSCLGAAALLGVVGMQAPALISAGHALEGGTHPDRPCVLDITDAYLAHLADVRRALILTGLPLKPLAQWTLLERHGGFDRLEEHWYGFGAPGEENRHGFEQWLQSTDSDTIIYCERTTPRTEQYQPIECRLHGELRDLLLRQQRFRLVEEKDVPSQDCRVQVWRR
jgi:hypothetical protein